MAPKQLTSFVREEENGPVEYKGELHATPRRCCIGFVLCAGAAVGAVVLPGGGAHRGAAVTATRACSECASAAGAVGDSVLIKPEPPQKQPFVSEKRGLLGIGDGAHWGTAGHPLLGCGSFSCGIAVTVLVLVPRASKTL